MYLRDTLRLPAKGLSPSALPIFHQPVKPGRATDSQASFEGPIGRTGCRRPSQCLGSCVEQWWQRRSPVSSLWESSQLISKPKPMESAVHINHERVITFLSSRLRYWGSGGKQRYDGLRARHLNGLRRIQPTLGQGSTRGYVIRRGWSCQSDRGILPKSLADA